VLDPGETTAKTDANGGYEFNHLAAGSYVIRQMTPSGWTQTYPSAGRANAVTLGTGQFVDTEKFRLTNLLKTGTVTQGNWQHVYGSQGYNVIDNATSYPSYAQVSASGNNNFVWSNSTTDSRALQDASSSSSRIAACWFSRTSFTVNVNITDGQSHQLALYLLDWDKQGRKEQVQITDATTGTVLDTESASNFSNGEYLVWNVSGDINIKISNLNTRGNAVISGLFFDPVISASFTGLIAYYPMNEANWSGPDSVTDATGNGHNGTPVGGATTVPDSQFGRVGSFDGKGQYVTVGGSGVITGARSVVAWVYVPSDYIATFKSCPAGF